MIGIVIPVFNEVQSLEPLCAELDAVAREHQYDLDIVLVDDGSTDGSWKVIESLAARDRRIRGIRLRRNFGKAAALSAGFEATCGNPVITLDADLQDDPAEIPRFVEKLNGDLDVVSGWKEVRHDPWHKVWPSHVFNWMVGKLTGVRLHDHNCGMKCYRSEVLREIRIYGELHRFIPVLAHARGFRVGELSIHHRPRRFGHSKYGLIRFIKGFLDLLTVAFLTSFGQRPAHLLGAMGLLSFSVGALGMLYLTGYWVAARLSPESGLLPLHERPAVLYCVAALLLGGQLLSMGLLAELMAAQRQQRDLPPYSIAQRTALADPEPAACSEHERST
jgi:dolichol-phosphate mannosyltransferase